MFGIKIIVVFEAALQLRTCFCRRIVTDGEASVSGLTVHSGSGSSRLPFAQASKQAQLCSCSGRSRTDILQQLRHSKRAEQLVDAARRSDDAGGNAVFEVPSQAGPTSYKVVVALLGSAPACLKAAVQSCGCLDHIDRGAICKHAGAVFLWWHLQESQLVDKAPVTDVSACEGADSSQFLAESLRACCSKRRAGGRSGAVDTGLGAAMSSCAPNGPIPSTAACCAAAAVEPGRAIRRALEFGNPRNSKARASSVPALEVPFHEPYPEPKSALKMSQSPAGPLAAEKRVRVVVGTQQVCGSGQ